MRFIVKESAPLQEFLLKAMNGISKTSVKQLLQNRFVYVDGKPNSKYDFLLTPGMSVEINKEKKASQPFSHLLEIIYEDDYIIVANKKEGLLSVTTDNTSVQITAHSILNGYIKENAAYTKRNKFAKEPRVYIVHRLDRDTSGLMVFAKDENTKRIMQDEWEEIVTDRKYIAAVEGEMEREQGKVVSWLTDNKAFLTFSCPTDNGGKKAITHYRTLKINDGFSLVELDLETGRKNQIRVHMQDLGHSIIGDVKYGGLKSNRLYLHAYKLSFIHPITNEEMKFVKDAPFTV